VSHSSDIVDVLSALLDKAEAQLDKIRHAELDAAHNIALLKHSLEDELAQDKGGQDRVQNIFRCRKSRSSGGRKEFSRCVGFRCRLRWS